MKIRIGDKVYLQRYEVRHLLDIAEPIPASILYSSYTIDYGGFAMNNGGLDFTCCYSDDESVNWLMNRKDIIDYDEYVNIPVNDLCKLMKRLICDRNELVETFRYHNEAYKAEHLAEYQHELKSYDWKRHSIGILIDAKEGKNTFTYPEDYEGTRIKASQPISGSGGRGIRAMIAKLLEH